MFKRTTREKYWYALEVLPPAYQAYRGFLLGEPTDHRRCTVTNQIAPTYAAFIERKGRYYASVSSMTKSEFVAYLKKHP